MSKYGARRTQRDAIGFASKREADRWSELRLLEKAGQIRGLQRQVSIALLGREGPLLTPTGRVATYRADFTYQDRALEWAWVVEDAKGFPTPEYKLKRAILAAQGVTVRET